jgi:hypothetical protein
MRLDRGRVGFRRQCGGTATRRKGLPGAVLESGPRHHDQYFAKSAWNLRRCGLRPSDSAASMRRSPFSHVFIALEFGVSIGNSTRLFKYFKAQYQGNRIKF